MTQRPIGRGPLPAKDVVNLGDPLPTEQCVTALKPIAVPEENLPDWARSAPESAPNSATRLTINEQEARRHLKLLGLDPDVTNIRAIGRSDMAKLIGLYGTFTADIHRAEKWHRQGCGLYHLPTVVAPRKRQFTECMALGFWNTTHRPVLEQLASLPRALWITPPRSSRLLH